MAKEFNKKFMHPTRRKLVDMVLTGGEYEKNTQISFSGADNEIIKREVGERWTDNKGKSWEQYEAGKIEVSELGDIMAETRAYLDIYIIQALNLRVTALSKMTFSITALSIMELSKRA